MMEYKLGAEGDHLYRELLELHHGLSAEESAALNARIILSLMNQIGDAKQVREAFKAARLLRSDVKAG